MDVSYTNVLEVSRQYFQGLPVPSTAGTITLTDNVTTSTSSSFDHGTSTIYSSATTPAVASATASINNSENQGYSESKPEETESSSSYWNPLGPNDLRPVEPYPPQLTRVEVPDTRPEDSAMEPGHGSSTLTEMQPSKQRTVEQKQEPSSTVPANEPSIHSPQLHQMQPPKSQSPAPVYQQLNSVSRTPYSSAESLASHTTYQGERSSPSSSIVTQRVQYYPRYHHPDIRKSAPAPFSQSSMYQSNSVPPSASPSGTVQCVPIRPGPTEQGLSVSAPTSSHSQPDQQRVSSAYSPAQGLVGGSSVYGTSPQNHHPSSYLGAQRRIGTSNLTSFGGQHSDGHSSSSSSSSVNPCSPRLGSSSTTAGSSSHIPSPHNIPAHIPSPHLPSGSSSASSTPQSSHQHPSRNVPTSHTLISNTYPGRAVLTSPGNQQLGPQSSPGYHSIPSPHELGQHTSPSPQRQSPHVSALHNPHASPHHTPSPHNNYHQPHSPPYPPPPSRSTPQSYGSVPPTSQQYQASGFSNPYHSTPQSSYHSFQKSPQPPHSSYYSQPGRPHYPQHLGVPPQTSLPCSTPGSNGAAYQRSEIKPVTYNGADLKKSPADVTTYGSYRPPPAPIQRTGNTHNLPPIGALSFQNRNSREPLAKPQVVQRQRTHSISSVTKSPLAPPPAPSMAAPRRVTDYPLGPTPMSHTIPINGRITSIPSSSYSRYNQQGGYPPYATTVAPSHYGSNSSSSTTVTSVGLPARTTVPTHSTNHQYPTSDPRQPPAPYSSVARAPENYGFKDYYPNSSTYSSSQPAPAPPSQSNGLPVRKRESPLDLSVKTVKTSADSTAQDDEAGNMDKHVSSSNSVTSRSSSGNRNMLPPAQPPPASLFTFDTRSTNGARSSNVSSVRASTPQTVCAPKVEFYPDFNSTPLRHHTPSRENSLRRSSAQQLYAPPQQTVPLPHMSTFKKSSLPPTPLYDVKSMPPPPYHPNDSALARTSMHPSVLDPTRAAHVLPHQETSESKYYLDSNKFTPPASQSTEKHPLKRPAEPTFSGGTANKQPKVENWRILIDKQIQQKLTSARALHEQQKRQEMNLPPPLPNGSMVAPGAYDQKPDIPYSSESARYQAYCDKRNYQDPKAPRSSPSYLHPVTKPSNVHSMPQPSGSQMGYLGYRPAQRMPYGTSHPGGQPSNTGADKRVLSLLRNSLENKQQREEQMNSQQPILVNHSQQSFQNKVVTPVEPKTNIGRHNLSPFAAASLLERNSNTPPHYKFHVPKAVDSITQDGPRGMYGSRMNLLATLPGKESMLNPRVMDNQMLREKDDGLAAKFRTKGELKQVGMGQIASKPPSLLTQDSPATLKELEGAASTSTPQTPGSSVGSPPKLTREKVACLPPRRRLFSRTEEENMPISATVPAPAIASTVSPRASGFRSSSETSVFDFRESDSEGEMPVLERQTLEKMRRDRKQLSKVQPPVPLNDAMCMAMTSSTDLVKIELKENDKMTEMDPFWAATCDKFMEQLRNGDSVKKRGRKKKTENTVALKAEVTLEPNIVENESEAPRPVIRPEDIKKEIPYVDSEIQEVPQETSKEVPPPKVKTELKAPEVLVKEEEKAAEDDKEKAKGKEKEKVKDSGKNSGDDSDELPLIKRTKKRKTKKNDSDGEEDIVCRKNRIRRGSRIKLESSSGSESSSEESDASTEFGQGSSVADRLRARKRTGKEKLDSEGMKLRSRGNTPHKGKQQEKETKSSKGTPNKSKPKPLFGDGSDFRPGWEEEVYVYKKSLRMPSRLITVSKPARFHRLSTSLPDLDPGSPVLSVSMDSADVCLNRKRVNDSDVDSNYSFSIAGLGTKIEDEEATSSTTISCPPKLTRFSRSDNNSIVDVLAQKVGTSKKETRKTKEKVDKSPTKILRRGNNEPELLPTPSLTPFIPEESPKVKGKTPIKNNKSPKPIKVSDMSLLGYFRKETINNFRDTFKNNHALPNEFSTVVLKSRTRTETRVLKKQATIREVFGEDRPASAPPMRNHGDTSQDDDSQNESQCGVDERTLSLKRKVVSRWRNAGLLRSKKAIVNSKKHLLISQRRKDILESIADNKLKQPKEIKKEIEDDDDEEDDDEEEEEEQIRDGAQEAEVNEPETENNDDAELPSKKKFRTGRRKFRSGFDYIRKKKKPLKKDEALPKERKRQVVPKPNPECEADIQSEIRTWVIKKGVGETILHRAARLGYTDVAAYCLEKLNNVPSPKDNAGYTPLHEACAKGHLEIAKLLLAYGANVSESANGGIRPLHEAAENGAAELVRLLLSYGADPLLATYAGQTPLMLAVDTEAYQILEEHLSDIQGRPCQPWHFCGPSTIFDPEETGYNPLQDAPTESPKAEMEEIEMEVSDVNLPVLFTLNNDSDKWILLQDLMTSLKMKSRDALLRQLNPNAPAGPPAIAHRDVLKQLKLADFLDQSRCCHLLSAGEKINVRGSKVSLIKYNDKVKSLLNVERVLINMR